MEPFYQIQFLKDCAKLTQLKSHENLIEFLGYCKSNDWLYLIFEEPQQSLKNLLVTSRTTRATHPSSISTLSENTLMKMLYEISSAMEFICKQQVVIFIINISLSKLILRVLYKKKQPLFTGNSVWVLPVVFL